MSWGIVAGTTASVVGAGVSSKSAGDATDAANKGNAASLAFQEEGRDLAREDQAPYRQAGATALDALMSMTGLGLTDFGGAEEQRSVDNNRVTGQDYLTQMRGVLGKKGRKQLDRYVGSTNYEGGTTDDQAYIDNFTSSLKKKGVGRSDRFEQQNPYGRAIGGNTGPMRTGPVGRAGPTRFENTQYNINENGPENNYNGGAVTRTTQPQTIEPSQDGYVQPNENPGGVEGGYNFQTDPGYEFRKAEGERAIDRGASARGGVLSGGTAKAITRFGQDYASNEYSNVYNRIAGIAGIGTGAANNSGGYAMNSGTNMGGTAADAGMTSGYGVMAEGNAWANAANEIGGQDWGSVFNRPSGEDREMWEPK